MIERAPDRVFAILWALAVVFSLAAGIVGVGLPWFALGVGTAVLALEIAAVAWPGELRKTLSEITTWTNRRLSKHKDPLRGWNTLVAIQAVILGRLIYVVIVGFGGAETIPFAAFVGIVFAIGQHDHWLDPPTHG